MIEVNFASLPPEVSSGWLYSGPGSGSMLAAAASWDQLAIELSSAAAHYQTVISTLTDESWHGPAAASMSAAATPYVAWLTATAEQARQAATQARAAAAAYQQARAAVVPPPVITANRSMLQKLVTTNTIGQNTPAIAANQAQYGEMWAQDAAVMHTYASSSAAAATLTPFAEPKRNTNQAGRGNQAAAASQAAQTGSSQSNPLLTWLEQANHFFATNPVWKHDFLIGGAGGAFETTGAVAATAGAPGYMAIATPIQDIGPVIRWFFPHIIGGAAAAATMSEVSGSAMGSTLVSSSGPQLGAGVAAGLGRAASLGGLSVPQSWSAPVQLASAASPLPTASPVGAPAVGASGMGGIPMVPAMVDKPGNHKGMQNGPRTRLIAGLGVAGPPGRPRSHASGVASPLSDRERSELDTLRTIVADLVDQRDKAANAIKEAIHS